MSLPDKPAVTPAMIGVAAGLAFVAAPTLIVVPVLHAIFFGERPAQAA